MKTKTIYSFSEGTQSEQAEIEIKVMHVWTNGENLSSFVCIGDEWAQSFTNTQETGLHRPKKYIANNDTKLSKILKTVYSFD